MPRANKNKTGDTSCIRSPARARGSRRTIHPPHAKSARRLARSSRGDRHDQAPACRYGQRPRRQRRPSARNRPPRRRRHRAAERARRCHAAAGRHADAVARPGDSRSGRERRARSALVQRGARHDAQHHAPARKFARAGAVSAASAGRLSARAEADRTRHHRARTDAADGGRASASSGARAAYARHDSLGRARRRRRALHRQDSRHARARNAFARRAPHAARIDGHRQGDDARPRSERVEEAARRVAPGARPHELQAGEPPGRRYVSSTHDALFARRLHLRPRRKRGVDSLRRRARARCVGRDRRGAFCREHYPLYAGRTHGRTDPGRAARSAFDLRRTGWRAPQANRRIKR